MDTYDNTDLPEISTESLDSDLIEPDDARGLKPLSDAGRRAMQGPTEGDGESRIVDRGIQEVPLNQVDLNDSHVRGDGDFQKVSHDEMVEGYRKLDQVVRPAVVDGANGDTFAAMDARQNLAYPEGYQRIYDAFYGSGAIRLEKQGDNYNVVNGYHRLAVARELGLASVPAHVLDVPG